MPAPSSSRIRAVDWLRGLAVLFMILTGTANVYGWLLTTVAHVVAGTITLLASARLAHLLRTRPGAETVDTAR